MGKRLARLHKELNKPVLTREQKEKKKNLIALIAKDTFDAFTKFIQGDR